MTTKTLTERRIEELVRLSDKAGIPREMVTIDAEAQAVRIPAGLYVALCYDSIRGDHDLVKDFVAGAVSETGPAPVILKPKRTLSPEHLAKLKAGREAARLAKTADKCSCQDHVQTAECPVHT